MLLVTVSGATEARNEGLDRIIKAGAIRIAVPDGFELAGRSIAVTRGIVEDTSLATIAPPGAKIERFNDNSDTWIAYMSWEAELIATGNVFAQPPLGRLRSNGWR